MTQFKSTGHSLSCKRRAAHSEAVMLHVWYAIAFRCNSHLGDFPFVFLLFSQFLKCTLRCLLGFGLALVLALRLVLRLRLGLKFIFYVYFILPSLFSAASRLSAKSTLPS